MKYMRRTAGYIWTDYKTNAQIAKELKITPILDKLVEYKRNWIQHVNRMPRNKLPRVMKRYYPTGRRNHGRPLKRLLDTWDRNGSTSGPTPWQIYDDDDGGGDDDDDDDDERGCLTSKFQFFFVIYLFFCFIIFVVISCSSLLSDRPLVKLDAVSGTGRTTLAVADTGLKMWAVLSGQRLSLHTNSRCLHERFSLKRWMVQEWWVEQRMAWRQVGKARSWQHRQRSPRYSSWMEDPQRWRLWKTPPSLEQGCQHVLVCEGCQNRFMPEGTGIPSSLCCFPHGTEDSPQTHMMHAGV